MTDPILDVLLEFRDDVPEPTDEQRARAYQRAAAFLPTESAARRGRGVRRLLTRPALVVAAFIGVVGIASGAVVAFRTPSDLQSPKGCVAVWNRHSTIARRTAVTRVHAIAAMVVGTGVLVPGPAPRCALLVMGANGSWYATEAPTARRPIVWSPLRPLPNGDAASYNTSGKQISASVTVLPRGNIALS